VILSILVIIMVLPGIQLHNQQPDQEFYTGYESNTVSAKVINMIEEGVTDLGGTRQNYQIFDVEILDGDFQGAVLTVDYGLRQILGSDEKIRNGDLILVTVGQRPDTAEVKAFFTDFVRSRPILYLFLLFVFFSVLISGWKGIRSLLGIGFSLLIIVFYILPQILSGKDPVWVSITGAFVFLAISQFLVYGWNLKTHSAVIGIFISLIITGTLSSFFVDFTRLTGYGDENAMFLSQMSTQTINIKGLLLAGMLIGALGVLDDLVISQASAVFELFAANSSLSFRFLFKRAMNIGRDHAAATVNTLVLAYAGASLPMLLLFTISNQNPAMLINISFIAEEIVRTLVGSIGLFISIPVTTALAALLATRHQQYPWIRKYFGPDNQWSEIHHHH
ncbi:MAG TPA: YibE/F family protein, partial [Anaerolineaceae bacterium]|nr:YibE/F family protein [Anaerolineaceae bacterium]